MKVNRKHARLCIIFVATGIILLLLSSILNNVIVAYFSIPFIVVSFIIKFFVLKCPHCGWGGMPPQWSKSGTIHCPKCGHAIEYTDN